MVGHHISQKEEDVLFEACRDERNAGLKWRFMSQHHGVTLGVAFSSSTKEAHPEHATFRIVFYHSPSL